MREIAKLKELDTRPPEAGRIRLGVKVKIAGKDKRGNDKTRAESIDTFRFTAPPYNRRLLDQLAALYGGTVEPWHDDKASPRDQFQVITTTNTIPVFLPSGALSVWYERWGGAYCERRCDGEVVEIPVESGDGWEPQSIGCLCAAEGVLTCRPTTRLSVVIPTIDFGGVWRLESKGWNAQKELPGMVGVIETMAAAGTLLRAELSTTKQERMTFKGPKRFVVPKLSIPHTPLAMLEGAAIPASGVLARAHAPLLELEVGGFELRTEPVVTKFTMTTAKDGHITDAELIDAERERREERLDEIARQQSIPGPERFVAAIVRSIENSPTVPGTLYERMDKAIAALESGALVFQGFNPDGSIIWRL